MKECFLSWYTTSQKYMSILLTIVNVIMVLPFGLPRCFHYYIYLEYITHLLFKVECSKFSIYDRFGTVDHYQCAFYFYTYSRWSYLKNIGFFIMGVYFPILMGISLFTILSTCRKKCLHTNL